MHNLKRAQTPIVRIHLVSIIATIYCEQSPRVDVVAVGGFDYLFSRHNLYSSDHPRPTSSIAQSIVNRAHTNRYNTHTHTHIHLKNKLLFYWFFRLKKILFWILLSILNVDCIIIILCAIRNEYFTYSMPVDGVPFIYKCSLHIFRINQIVIWTSLTRTIQMPMQIKRIQKLQRNDNTEEPP